MKRHLFLLWIALAILVAAPAPAQVGAEAVPAELVPLPKLPVLQAENGTLSTTLRLVNDHPNLIETPMADDWVMLRSYNGGLSGPVLEMRPGQTLEVLLDNRLPCLREPCQCQDGPALEHHHLETVQDAIGAAPKPEVFNTTNLHTHGLHVTPKDPGDNVLRPVLPGCKWRFRFTIPRDHPAGTFWYHPHWHGSTAIQVGSGVVGALIVRGGMDEVPEIKAAEDEVLLFQQIPYTCEAKKRDPKAPCTLPDPGKVESFEGSFGPNKWPAPWQYTTINGVAQPVIYMDRGEVQRWRMIHGGVRESLNVAVATEDYKPLTGWLHEIALDGLPTGEITPRSPVELEPGYRADVLVKAPQVPGRYLLLDMASKAEDSLLAEAESRKILAVIIVQNEIKDMRLPTSAQLADFRLPSVRDDEVRGRPIQTVQFNIADGKFTVDGEEFPGRHRILELGKADEWVATSRNANHPFHIHVNPFEVIEPLPGGGERRYWKDTILVRPGKPVRFRSRYTVFDGWFVLHCHILDHEDRGMMQMVRIMAPAPVVAPTTEDKGGEP